MIAKVQENIQPIDLFSITIKVLYAIHSLILFTLMQNIYIILLHISVNITKPF